MKFALLFTIFSTFLVNTIYGSCATDTVNGKISAGGKSCARYSATSSAGAVETPSPLTILTNVTLWYDLQDATNITVTGGKVAGLTDKSPAGNNATQGTAALRPTYDATGINGFPCMTTASAGPGLQMASTAVRIPSSIFVVTKKNSDIGGMIISKAGNLYGIYNILTYILAYDLDMPGEVQTSTGSTDLLGSIIQYNLSSTNGASQIYLNNTALTTTINTGWPAGVRPGFVYLMGLVGARDYIGSIGEVIVSDTASTTQRNNMYAQLKAKWGTP